MQELSGLDAAFLYVETTTAHMHVVGTIILEDGDEPFRFDNLKRMMANRIHRIPAFRRRMHHVPLRLGHPIWVDDPDFRLSAHLHRIALPRPGSMRELESFVGHVAAIPLDRERPLWELWAVENLRGGRTALVCKFHHAAIDGVSGAELLQHLLDLSPDWNDDEETPTSATKPAPLPSNVGLLAAAAAGIAAQPFRLIQNIGYTAASVLEMLATYVDPKSEVSDPALPLSAPDTFLNNAISSDRVVAFGEVQLKDVKTIKNSLGYTVNDVVLAACSIALRTYLDTHGDLPEVPLIAAIPVSLHDDSAAEANNAVSAMFVRLPVHLEHPLEHLEFVATEAGEAKALHGSSRGSLLSRWAELASPTWFAGLIDLYSRFNLADTHAPLYNLVVSNVPGPPVPLYCVGHKVSRCHPLGPIFEGAAVNITVMSYVDSVGIGIVACPESAPDIERIRVSFEKAIAALLRAVDKRSETAEKTTNKGSPGSKRTRSSGRRGRSGKKRAAKR